MSFILNVYRKAIIFIRVYFTVEPVRVETCQYVSRQVRMGIILNQKILTTNLYFTFSHVKLIFIFVTKSQKK
jgi:hypothetical protein